jgi:carbon-monoxide dehydrogenase medium subunit
MSVLPPFSLVRPSNLDDALAEIDDDALPYVGGTEILLAMRAGLLRPAALVDLKGVADLNRLETDEHTLRIGASATHHDVARHAAVVERVPLLADVLHRVGNARVRATGTLGGNLCFAEPKSDVATALVALDAGVVLRSPRGERALPVRDFVVGPYTTDREPDELLVRIDVPLVPERRGVYLKYQTMERPSVGVAAVEWNGTRRVVVGAVSEIPMVFDDDIDPEAIATAIDPIPDLTGSERYKRHVTSVFVARALALLQEDAA